MKEYPYRKMNEMREILEVLQMPSKLKNTRTILTLLAVARHLCAVWQLWNIMVLNPRVRKAVIV